MDRVRLPLLPRALRWLGVFAVAGAVAYFSLVRVPPETPQPNPLWDETLHVLAYVGLGLALAYATVDWRDRPATRVAVVIGAAVAFGAGVELVQGTLPVRDFAWTDLLADALGATLACGWVRLERRVEYVRGFAVVS